VEFSELKKFMEYEIKGQVLPKWLMDTHFWMLFLAIFLRYAGFIDEGFSGKKKDF
jgi:hypothetical protein